MKTFLSWLLAHIEPLSVFGFMALIIEYVAFKGTDISWSISTNNMLKTMAVVQIPIALVFAIWAAKFTYQNFDEVWSRRMSWNNSNVDKMNTRFSYSSKIFLYSLLAGVGMTAIAFLFGYMIKKVIF